MKRTDTFKCDEIRPECKKCIAFGVNCNYDPKTPDLQMSFGRAATITDNDPQQVAKRAFLANPTFLGNGVVEVPAVLTPTFTVSDSESSFDLDKYSLGLLERFQMRTILTLGTSKTAPIYQEISISEAFAVSVLFLSRVICMLTHL
jgi:hypothetical protein